MDLTCTLYHTCLYENDDTNQAVYPDFLEVMVFLVAQKGVRNMDSLISSPDNDIIFDKEDRLLTDIDLRTLDNISGQAFPDNVELDNVDNDYHYDSNCHHPYLPTHFTPITIQNYSVKVDSILDDLESRMGYLIHSCKLENLQLATGCWGPMQYRFDLNLSFKDNTSREIIKIFTIY